ncbi:PEPxxWA-CTERM sorting domain-containing protein [Polymorphobacter fuscus]|uniref:PEPxxWA-CTERM sorting domain-containing protein n=2 Tax=Sandarakinorhabdus fusca TaxID=1439888 RepID=A0A7C9GQV7_9SPHN|nr:PEP-CTERM sorting domain-containing protein [Polymorphobacter fuscus]MQT18557.1 PEPxxWA-CTERM sorting domain-containing protein [Polymorphobacter fuscus]
MLLGAAAVLVSTAANAADFSFTGALPNPGTVQFFDFAVGAPSNVTLRTWSYAGGVNAAGQTIARGGFDPILALFDLSSGVRINENDDGGCGLVAADAVSGQCWDTFLTSSLGAGNYRVSVQVYPNFAPDNLSGTFAGATTFDDVSGTPNNPRSNQWAFDILGVESASQGVVPEPASWAMLIAGFGLTGAAMRRRRTVTAVSA